MLKKIREKKGITLVALVITIIVLIILAGISIKLVLGNNGLIEKAIEAKENTILAQEDEENKLNELYSSIMVATGDGAEITISMQDLNTLIENKVKEQLENTKTESVPAGTVISYMGNNAPEGYLFCDGTTYNISEYSDLAEQIKNEFGSYNYYGGDGETTFAVPNLQGEFLRGYSTSTTASKTSGVSTASVGKNQAATNHVAISSSINGSYWYSGYASGENMQSSNYDTVVNYTGSYKNQQVTTSLTDITDPRKKMYTSRPTNTSVLYCIKY